MLTEKQIGYLKAPPRRWNVKSGAVRSGKTYCDFFVIPLRIRKCPGEGIVVLLGYTVGTLVRNVIDPMRRIWGDDLVGLPSDSGTVELFGRKCWLIGAGKADQAERLRGCSVAYAYGDEITSWSEEVFEMLKSRLDLPGSVFDGTCNPSGPGHWFRRFLKSGADVFLQEYVIDDNPELSREFVESLKKEYEGTPFYDRYILGRWVCPEGLIYARFAADPLKYFSDGVPDGLPLVLGVDFGGTKSGTAFVACRPDRDRGAVWCVRAEVVRFDLDFEALSVRFSAFLSAVRKADEPVTVYCDNAEPILIRSLRTEMSRSPDGAGVTLRGAIKRRISERIAGVLSLINRSKLFLTHDAETLSDALCGARWGEGISRLDDGTSDIDTLDAFEYAIEREPFFCRTPSCAGGEPEGRLPAGPAANSAKPSA